MALAKTVIIHGKRDSPESPRKGRPECALWGVTRANTHYWGSRLSDWTAWFDIHPLTQAGRFDGIPQRRPATWDWFKAQDGKRPIYLMDPEVSDDPVRARELFAQVPGATVFPIREIQDRFQVREVWQ